MLSKKRILLSIVTIGVGVGLVGCTSPKTIEYKPYASNSYLYRTIVSKNKMEWRTSLLEDISEYKSYLKHTFIGIDNYKTYLAKTHNVSILKIKETKTVVSNELRYDDVIFNDEYGF